MLGNVIFIAIVVSASSGDQTALFGLQTQALLRLLYLVVGIVLLTVTIIDLLWTTLWSDEGAGPLSSRLMAAVWRGLRYVGSKHSWVLSIGGAFILSLNLIMWLGLIWLGWTFLFAGGENALIYARSSGPVTWTGRIYFVAQAMFTMGNGDFYPASGGWQIATAFTTASGILSVTLAVAYVISVLGGVVDSRSYANSVMGVGRRSEAFIRTGWNGEDFYQFDLVLDTLSSELSRLAAQHKIHPILHYYRSKQDQNSAAMAIAIFDEALTVVRFGIPDEHQPNSALVETARSNAQSYLQAFTDTVEPADQAPPAPDLDSLRDEDIPTVSDEEFADALEDLNERRRLLLAVVEANGWSWPSTDEN